MRRSQRLMMTCPDCGWRANVPEGWFPPGEIKRLRDALREIAKGRLPEDYGRYDITAARMSGIAREALTHECET